MRIELPPTLGLVLAGGRASRMGGGDKTLLKVGGTTILERVLARIRPHCTAIVLNANGDPSRFAAFGLPVVADEVPDFAGPLNQSKPPRLGLIRTGAPSGRSGTTSLQMRRTCWHT